MRTGKMREPHYRIVVADARAKRDGRSIEVIGRYHPKEDPSVIQIDSARAQHWLSVGAQPSEAVRALMRVTGDWQRFRGEPPPPPMLVRAAAVDRRAVFETAAREAAAEQQAEESESAAGARRRPARRADATPSAESAQPEESTAPVGSAASADPTADAEAGEAAAPAAGPGEPPAAEV